MKEHIIFIIDDSPEDRGILRGHLLNDAQCTYSIFEEETGEKSLELCKSTKPDCILLDYLLTFVLPLQ